MPGNFLDMRTLLVVAAAGHVVMVLGLSYLRKAGRTHPGFVYWILGAAAAAVGFGLLALRGLAGLWLTVAVANGLIMGGAALLCHGVAVFAEQRSRPWAMAALWVAGMAALCWFLWVRPEVNARIVIVTGVLGSYYLAAGWTARDGLGAVLQQPNRLVSLALAMLIAFAALRIVATLGWQTHLADFMRAGLVQGLATIFYITANLMLIMGLAIANHQRVDLKLRRAERELASLEGFLPVCAGCKSVRDEDGRWHSMESYIQHNSEAKVTSCLCEGCLKKLYPEVADKVLDRVRGDKDHPTHECKP